MNHKFLVELFLNDENGNPKGRESFQYFDSEVNLQAFYEEKKAIFQTKTVVDEETGEEKTVTTSNRKYTVKVSESKYILNSNPTEIWERIRG